MTILRINLKQHISDDYRYWFDLVTDGFFRHFGKITTNHYICVSRDGSGFVVSLHEKEDVPSNSLVFRVPENYNNDTDYHLLKAWATNKIYNWYVQFKGKGELPLKHSS